MAIKISLDELLETGAHFGHQARRWNPKMKPYLYGSQEGVHVFDLTKTKEALEEALNFLTVSSKEGKVILFLGTKKQARDKVKEVAIECGMPYVYERWLGGAISNFEQINKSIKKLAEMKEAMAAGEYAKYTKKERLLMDREIARLERFFGGLTGMQKPPDVLFIADVKKETGAAKEARSINIPVVGIVDSNADPDLADYPIPANDDATKVLDYILELVKQAVLAGKSKTKSKK
ncbi:30S ribosomal protein S2 [Patescibacteria group bacterium]